jgi:hypothetical protein
VFSGQHPTERLGFLPAHRLPFTSLRASGKSIGPFSNLRELLRFVDLVLVQDYVDVQVPVLSRMFAKRPRGYRSLGYVQGEAPAGFGGIDDDFILGRDWAEIDGEDDGTE